MDITQLENRIKMLEDWKAKKEKQQISFPLDIESQTVLRNYFMAITGVVKTVGGASGNEFTNYIGKQGNYNFQVDANTFYPYSVVVSSNVFTVQGIAFQNDQQVYVSTSDTPPAPLTAGTQYFVVSASGFTFKLALTSGGTAIDITDTGIGLQYIYFF